MSSHGTPMRCHAAGRPHCKSCFSARISPTMSHHRRCCCCRSSDSAMPSRRLRAPSCCGPPRHRRAAQAARADLRGVLTSASSESGWPAEALRFASLHPTARHALDAECEDCAGHRKRAAAATRSAPNTADRDSPRSGRRRAGNSQTRGGTCPPCARVSERRRPVVERVEEPARDASARPGFSTVQGTPGTSAETCKKICRDTSKVQLSRTIYAAVDAVNDDWGWRSRKGLLELAKGRGASGKQM